MNREDNTLNLEDIVLMNKKERETYFFDHAGYMPDAPNQPYTIRIGTASTSLFSADTADLRAQFETEIKRMRRRKLAEMKRQKSKRKK